MLLPFEDRSKSISCFLIAHFPHIRGPKMNLTFLKCAHIQDIETLIHLRWFLEFFWYLLMVRRCNTARTFALLDWMIISDSSHPKSSRGAASSVLFAPLKRLHRKRDIYETQWIEAHAPSFFSDVENVSSGGTKEDRVEFQLAAKDSQRESIWRTSESRDPPRL